MPRGPAATFSSRTRRSAPPPPAVVARDRPRSRAASRHPRPVVARDRPRSRASRHGVTLRPTPGHERDPVSRPALDHHDRRGASRFPRLAAVPRPVPLRTLRHAAPAASIPEWWCGLRVSPVSCIAGSNESVRSAGLGRERDGVRAARPSGMSVEAKTFHAERGIVPCSLRASARARERYGAIGDARHKGAPRRRRVLQTHPWPAVVATSSPPRAGPRTPPRHGSSPARAGVWVQHTRRRHDPPSGSAM
jgi:hypothetical protein